MIFPMKFLGLLDKKNDGQIYTTLSCHLTGWVSTKFRMPLIDTNSCLIL